jgi:hypothetical protein
MLQPINIKNQLILDYIKPSNRVNYWNKYNTARKILILDKDFDKLEKINRLRKEIENLYGYNISHLQDVFYSTLDLNAFIKMKRGYNTKIKMSEIKYQLNKFLTRLDDIMLEAYATEGVKFR